MIWRSELRERTAVIEKSGSIDLTGIGNAFFGRFDPASCLSTTLSFMRLRLCVRQFPMAQPWRISVALRGSPAVYHAKFPGEPADVGY